MTSRHLAWALALLSCAWADAQSPELAGVRISLDPTTARAALRVTRAAPFELRVQVERREDAQELALLVELPKTGREVWPANDVEVRDATGQALLVERSGIEWEKLRIPLSASVETCVVQAVEPPGGWPRATPEGERRLEANGLQVRLAPWPQGKQAALSLRFDDSHPSHLDTVIPILREYGFKGSFMVNPGPTEPGSRQNFSFETRQAEWAAAVQSGAIEFANHSAHHRGARDDEDMDREIGEAAAAIRRLLPGGSPLLALNLGGGTRWQTTRPLRHYLDRHQLFDASSGSLGMDDVYGGRVEALRVALDRHLERGLWCRIHYHSIGQGLAASEANFRAALDLVRQQQDKLWIAGMSEIHQYQTTLAAARLRQQDAAAGRLSFQLEVGTDPALYAQPLSLEVTPPAGAKRVVLVREGGEQIAPETGSPLRFSLPPRPALYQLRTEP